MRLKLREAILDALVDDPESIIQIYEYTSYLGMNVSRDQILEILNDLLIERRIKVVDPKNFNGNSLKALINIEDLWFDLTETGKIEWDAIDE